jgi:hypothetical protein
MGRRRPDAASTNASTLRKTIKSNPGTNMRVIYNGIALEIVHSREMRRTPVWSEDRTELLYMNFRYDLICTFNPQATSYEDATTANPGVLAGATDTSIRYALLENRKSLQLTADDGTVILQSPAAGEDLDVNNGPRPTHCTVTKITPATWMVAWGVETDVIECGSVSSSTSPILSNRFSQTQQTGEDHRTTIITRGLTVFRTDQLDNLNRVADYYRDQCIPGVALNFQRKSIECMVASPGNILTWTVVDQQQFVSIGGTNDGRRMGVVNFTDNFATRTGALDKANTPSGFLMCRLDLTAQGDSDSTLQGLFQWMAAFAVERCAIPNGPVNPETNGLILSVETSESLNKKQASLAITFQLPPSKNAIKGLGTLRADFIGIDVITTLANNGQNPQLPEDNNTRGNFNSQLFVNALKDACSAVPSPPSQQGDEVGYSSDNYLSGTGVGTGVTVNIYSGELSPSESTQYSNDATSNGTYNSMTVESKYYTREGVIPCPVASYPATSGSGNSGSSNADVVMIKVARGLTIVEYDWEAERSYSQPMAPNPCVNDPNLTLLEHTISPMAVGLAPDGQTVVYRIGGKYKYAAANARKAAAAVAFGVHPWTDFSYTDDLTNFPATNFVHGIIDNINGSSGGGGGESTGDPGQAT